MSQKRDTTSNTGVEGEPMDQVIEGTGNAGPGEKELDLKPRVPIAIDIEKTGSTSGSKVISVGIAMVWPDGTHKERLFSFARPKFPKTKYGEVLAPTLVVGIEGDPVLDKETKWPEWTAAWMNKVAQLPIVDYGDFEPRCWNEFWSQTDKKTGYHNINALIANLEWGLQEKTDNEIWYEVRHTIDLWCIEVIEKGFKPRIVSDNPGFDVGVVNARFEACEESQPILSGYGFHADWRRTRFEITIDGKRAVWEGLEAVPSGLHYIPTGMYTPEYNTVGLPKIGYTTIGDISRFETAVRVGWIPKEEPLVESVHSHKASDDALNIAARYAAYAVKYPLVS